MPLTLLTGPAGSGKTGEVLERFAGSLEREPVLVVPTVADVERYEDELLARRPVALGGRIVTFDRLFDLAASAVGLAGGPRLTRAQRRAVVSAALGDVRLEALAESARRPGFVDALDRLLGDCQAGLVGPAELADRLRRSAASRRRHLREVGALYHAYVERRERLGRADAHSLAERVLATLGERPAAWGGRPVLLHGFDDLTPAQLALVAALADEAEVSVSVVHERDRVCLAARRSLVERIEALGAEAGAEQLTLDSPPVEPPARGGTKLRRVALPARPSTSVLGHLERAFMTDAPGRRAPDDEVRLLAAAGVRNEVEQVGAAIARLLRAGTPPEGIAVITRSLDGGARLVEEVFESFGVPVAIHADRPLVETAVGRGLLAALRAAFTSQAATDVVAFLRAPERGRGALVDRLERAVRVERIDSADEALALWARLGGRPLWEVASLRERRRDPGALLEQAAVVARDLAERPHRRSAATLVAAERSDLAAAESVARALTELRELEEVEAGLAPTVEDLVTLLEGLRVPSSAAGSVGRVEVMTPYRARARQFAHVFVISLQEGEFPRRRRDDAFLTDAERATAGLPALGDQRDEERYLFYVCLTRATRALHLSFRTADDEGRAASRSFLVDEVLDLLAGDAEPAITESKGLSDTVFKASESPTERELARALAERREVEPPAALGVSERLGSLLAPQLLRARDRADRLPGSLRVPYVLEQFAAKTLIGASSLETQAECSFRYFVDHELHPRELAPPPEPLTRGGITHRVLERVYGAVGGVTPDTVADAIELSRSILAEEARRTSLSPERPAARATYRRMESDIARFLRYDAERGEGTVARLEAAFGEKEDDEKSALLLDGFRLHGKIDRIDLVGDGQALIHDYKTGSNVATRQKMAEERKLQLPLYMLAVRELWGLEPIGGVYHPLGKQYDGTPRGILRGPREASPLAERFVSRDYTSDADEFERSLLRAREEAERLAARIHRGHLARDPLADKCPRHCDFHPICRRERGEKNPRENGAAEDDDD
ncbi:MAG: PD-(D/E)XK nuclease family protein [Thermoleophilaceae bacterium]